MALDYLPSPGWAVVYGETPAADRWSELGENDDALATGVGLDDSAIKTRHLDNASVTSPKIDFTTLLPYLYQSQTYSIPARSVTAWTWYSDGSKNFELIAGRKYKIEATAASVPGAFAAEHIIQMIIDGNNVVFSGVYSSGGNTQFAGSKTFVASTTGTVSGLLQNRSSSNGSGTAQTLEVLLSMIG